MTAYILQMLFFALSIFSVAIMVIMILKDMKATKKQWWALLLPILLLFMTIAYRFDWNENTSSDLYRWFEDFEGLKRYGFDYEMQFADEFSWFWRVIAYVFAFVENKHWFPVFTIAIDYIIFFYILTETATEKRMAAYEVICCILLRLVFLPLIMSISASRNVLAYAFFSLGVYRYYKYGAKQIWAYLWMTLGVLTHSTVFLAAVIFLLSFVTQRYRKAIFLFLAVGVLFGTVIAPALEGAEGMFGYFGERWDKYIENHNTYDAIKRTQIITALAPMLIIGALWYMGKERSLKKERTSYIIANMAVTVSVYSLMPELFLRLCYPTANMTTVLWGEMRNTSWSRPTKAAGYMFAMIAIAVVGVLATYGAWMWQIYWFFEL